MNGSFSQRFGSVLVDCLYILAVLLAGKWKIIDGQSFALLLGGYGTGRVLVGKQKQDTNAMIGRAYAAGSQDRMRAVMPRKYEETPPDSDDDDRGSAPPRGRAQWAEDRPWAEDRNRGSGFDLEQLPPPVNPPAAPGKRHPSGPLGRDPRQDPTTDPPVKPRARREPLPVHLTPLMFAPVSISPIVMMVQWIVDLFRGVFRRSSHVHP